MADGTTHYAEKVGDTQHLGMIAIEKRAFGSPSTKVANLLWAILFTINHLFSHSLMVFKYCYVSLTIQLNISHLFTHS